MASTQFGEDILYSKYSRNVMKNNLFHLQEDLIIASLNFNNFKRLTGTLQPWQRRIVHGKAHKMDQPTQIGRVGKT